MHNSSGAPWLLGTPGSDPNSVAAKREVPGMSADLCTRRDMGSSGHLFNPGFDSLADDWSMDSVICKEKERDFITGLKACLLFLLRGCFI